jgi:hypothetical protein
LATVEGNVLFVDNVQADMDSNKNVSFKLTNAVGFVTKFEYQTKLISDGCLLNTTAPLVRTERVEKAVSELIAVDFLIVLYKGLF